MLIYVFDNIGIFGFFYKQMCIRDRLKSDYLSELSVYEMLPNSRIRSGFDRRMKKMINESYTDTAKTVRHRRVKLRLAIAVIIAATAALATGGTILLKHWDTFAVKENDKYSVILISDAENLSLIHS